MTPDNIHTKIDKIITGWNQGFGELQKRQKNGEKIAEQDVKKVILTAGKDIYQSGLTIKDVAASGYKTAEFEKIFDQASKPNIVIPSDTPSENANNTAFSSIQIAALDTASNKSNEPIAEVGQEGAASTQEPAVAMTTPIDAGTPTDAPEIGQMPEPAIADDVSKQAVKSSVSILEKLAPPDSLVVGDKKILNGIQEIPLKETVATATLNDKIFGITPTNDKELKTKKLKNGMVGGMSISNGQTEDSVELIQMPVRIIEPSNSGIDIGPI